MEVILLERVAKLGQMGEVVKVRDGFARNFLLKPRQGAARHIRQPAPSSTHEGQSSRPTTLQGQGRGDQGCREDRRPQRSSCCVRPRRPDSCSDR